MGLLVSGTLLVLLLMLNFLNFRLARSTTSIDHSLSTYKTGEILPDSMAPGFTLSYVVTSEGQLSEALATALLAEFETLPALGSSKTIVDPQRAGSVPLLLVDLAADRLWTPFYGQATITAQIFFADDGDVPWPLDEPVVFRDSPAIKADGQFVITDTTWGLISKPAYADHLAQALARAVAAALENDVFGSRPPVEG
jgi:hypothetical protein